MTEKSYVALAYLVVRDVGKVESSQELILVLHPLIDGKTMGILDNYFVN